LAGGREHDKLLYSIVNEFGGKFKGFRISRSFGAADRGEDRWFPAGFLKISYRRGRGKQSVVLFFIPPFCYTVIESAEKQGARVPFFGMLDR
jgi:hypothetical protein